MTIDVLRIMQMIPHRYPFLLLDKVVDVVKGKSCTGIKNVTINEDFFHGHFPQRPVMPGVLVIESMAQASAVLVVETLGKVFEGKLVYFMGIDDAKFRKPVIPGDVLQIKCNIIQARKNVYKLSCKAFTDGAIAAEAVVTAMIVDK